MKEKYQRLGKRIAAYGIAAGMLAGGGVMIAEGAKLNPNYPSQELKQLQKQLADLDGLEREKWNQVEVKINDGETVIIDASELKTKEKIVEATSEQVEEEIKGTSGDRFVNDGLAVGGGALIVFGLGFGTASAIVGLGSKRE